MIFYNGSSGGLGRFMAPALERQGRAGHALAARLEDRTGLREELAGLGPQADPVLMLLAARVSVPACEADPDGAFRTNVRDTVATTRDFVDWAREHSAEPRVVYVSTGHVYAERSSRTRLTESAPTAPRSVYARTKLQAEEALAQLAAERGFGLTIARVFGLMAPAQPDNYLLPGLIRRVRTDDLSGIPGLSCVRDYLDARDVCEDLLSLARATADSAREPVVFNVCSGDGVTIRDVLEAVVRLREPDDQAGLMSRASEAPGRPDDIPWIVGDPAAFVALTGTRPRRIPLEDTVRDALASG